MCTDRLSPIDGTSLELDEPLCLENGGRLDRVQVAYRTLGRLAPEGGNAVVVCHALTGSADVDQWWSGLIGPGLSLDPDRDFIICSNVLGSCYGTTGPASERPDTGRRWGPEFPAVTVRDVVEVQRRLLDALGVRKVRMVIGGSLGGMQALEWTLTDSRVQSAVVIACSARHSAWCIAQSEAQRAAIAADSRWFDGWYSPDEPPAEGLAAARMMAMCSYRSPGSFGERFGREGLSDSDYKVSRWLHYHGYQLVDRFEASSYVSLTRTMDRHDVGRGRGGVDRALGDVKIPMLVLAIDSDGLYPPVEQQEIADLVPGAEFGWIESPHGHDAFLIENDQLNRLVTTFRGRSSATSVRVAC